jgi:acetyltransferase-like isoleucine patch superfamily enzyme
MSDVTVVFVADDRLPAVQAALASLCTALDAFEAGGGVADVLIVRTTPDEATATFLAQIDGAQLLDLAAGTPRALAWQSAVDAASEPLIWLGGSDVLVDGNALTALVEQADGADATLPEQAPAGFGLFRRRSLSPDIFGASPTLEAVAARITASGTVVRVPGVGARPSPRRGARRIVRPGEVGAETLVELAHPEAFTIGVRSYLARGALVKTWSPYERIDIGAYCSIAEEVRIIHPGDGVMFDALGRRLPDMRMRGGHHPETATTFGFADDLPADRFPPPPPTDGSVLTRPLVIGDDVWVGWGATILGPVTVGTGAVVATGAVVMKDVPPYAVVAGNPAKVIRTRFSAPTIERLLRVRWWDWPEELVRQRAYEITGPLQTFLDRYDSAEALPAPA